MMVMMMVVMVDDNHHLRLRRIRNCEAEEKSQTKQNLLHAFRMTRPEEGF
ncbi:MAG: hypothetical protein WB424_07200 [Terracidiphilus sp.]|jgi:hypothetical protein